MAATYMVTEYPGQGALRWFLDRAAALLCERSGPEACGQCGGCHKARALTHPDLHVMVPLPSSAAKEPAEAMNRWREAVLDNPYLLYSEWMRMLGAAGKQGNMAAAQVRAFQQAALLHAYEGRRKVFLIWLAEYLGKEGNILLKTLEEPPQHTFFFLITQRPDRVLPTIRSRCVVYRLPVPPMAAFMEEARRQGIRPEVARQFYPLTRGSIGMLRQLQGAEWKASSDFFQQWRKAVKARDILKVWDLAGRMHDEGREGAKMRIEHMLFMLQQGLHQQQWPPYAVMIWLEVLEELREEAVQNMHLRHAFFARSIRLMRQLTASRAARLRKLAM